MEPIKVSVFDRVLGAFSPDMAVRRLIAKKKLNLFRYEGAQSNRGRSMPGRLEASESPSLTGDRVHLMKEARDLSENDPFVKSLLLKMSMYVCGSIQYQAMTDNPDVNSEYEDFLEEAFNVCDVTGRHSFTDLMQLSLMSTLRDGDVGFIIVNDGSPYLKLQGIEGDRIGNPLQLGAGDPKYYSGITIDDFGRPLSYRIFNRTKTNQYIDPKEIDAANFIHIFDPMRLDEYRGRTAFHAAITIMRDIHEILDAERAAVKFAAYQTAIVRTESGAAENSASFFDTTQDRNGNTERLEAVAMGKLNYVSEAEDIKMFESDRPSPAFQGFLQMLYRNVCQSVGVPYGFALDLGTLGGPSARLESAQAQRTFFRWQMILQKAMNRYKNLALARGIEAKEIPADLNWMKGKWMFPAHPTIDVGRESAANLNENRQGLKTAADIYAEQGKDWEEELKQLAVEEALRVQLAKQYSITPESIRMLTPNGNGPSGSQQQAEPQKQTD